MKWDDVLPAKILRKADVLKAVGGETPSDGYSNAVDHLAERLMRRERKPSVRPARRAGGQGLGLLLHHDLTK
jgi:hypothetical protein